MDLGTHSLLSFGLNPVPNASIRRDLFLYVGSQKLEFQKKKKKKKRILHDITMKLFVFGVIRNHGENNFFETSLSFGKLCKNYDKWGPCQLRIQHLPLGGR